MCMCMCVCVCVCVCLYMCVLLLVFQILACVFVFEMQKGFCWVIQLFSLVCTVKGYYDRKCFDNNDRLTEAVIEGCVLQNALSFWYVQAMVHGSRCGMLKFLHS